MRNLSQPLMRDGASGAGERWGWGALCKYVEALGELSTLF